VRAEERENDDEEEEEEEEELKVKTTISTAGGRVVDVSASAQKLGPELYILGRGYSVQAGKINFHGSRKFSYDAIIFTRLPAEESEEEKKKRRKTGDKDKERKPFTFNLPASIIGPMIDALLSMRGEMKTKEARE
jgi:hypothetical protein